TTNPTSTTPSPSRPASPSPSPSRSTASPSASPSSPPTTPPASGGCAVAYSVTGQGAGGFQGDVKITNNGSSAINGWTLRWTYANGQVISQLWNGTVSQTGSAVTVTNVSYNPTIAAHTTVDLGFLASWNNTTNAAPTSFTLNGAACTTG